LGGNGERGVMGVWSDGGELGELLVEETDAALRRPWPAIGMGLEWGLFERSEDMLEMQRRC
jgi:hypothetical protein